MSRRVVPGPGHTGLFVTLSPVPGWCGRGLLCEAQSNTEDERQLYSG